MTQSADLTRAISPIHWTARAGFLLPLLVGLLILLNLVLPYTRQWFVLASAEEWSSFTVALLSIQNYSLILLSIPALILNGLALFIARRPPWSRGLLLAILGCILSLILCGLLALYLYFLCCWKLQLHFVF